ncbi:MAG: preprotein translocase subunit YajC [Proteobacteria bacterium]|nr:preprotein translocase subunit YajC [Pseudomonadota bacterium]MBU1639172.1 preprotein translocase subunit YajC [Pseudomonadota bacterium]
MSTLAYAADGAAAAGGPFGNLGSFVPMILIFVVFYFLLIRPQQKKARQQQDFLGALKKGDEVVSSGGIYGKITGLTDTVVTLEIADGIRIKVSRSAIAMSAAAAQQPAACSTGG